MVLSHSPNSSHWWTSEEMVRSFRVTTKVINEEFKVFYEKALKPSFAKYQLDQFVSDVPGLAKRPAAPIPDPNAAALEGCAKYKDYHIMRAAISNAHRELLHLDRRLQESLRVGIEATDRSVARLGQYDILASLGHDSATGVPFQDGEKLPNWFKREHPPHPYDDPLHDEAAAATPSSPSPTSSPQADREHMPGNPPTPQLDPSSSDASSGTTVPEDFTPESSNEDELVLAELQSEDSSGSDDNASEYDASEDNGSEEFGEAVDDSDDNDGDDNSD